ncbi:MAG: EamA family transporter, partial [Candidatus Promineifilaceae bacterium]
MSLTAAVLIIISAFTHALWNLIGKRQRASLAFFSVSAVTVAVLTAPLLVLYRHSLPAIPPSFWLLLAATGVAQAVYFLGLTAAYRLGDISLVYPLARSIPILLVVAISFFLGKGSAITPVGLVGMVLIVAGCFILPLPSFQQLQWRHYFKFIYLMVLVTAVGTAAYTLIDDEAQRQLRETAAILLNDTQVTLLFIPLQITSTAVMMALCTLLFKQERQQFKELLMQRSLLISAALTGLIIMATYGLVLASMAYVTNVSYVAAFRQLSIPIGAIFGLTLLKEPRYTPKLVGIVVISIGL